jgi:hypothetical protein
LNEATDPAVVKKVQKMKARIEILADFEDLKKIDKFMKELSEG